MPSHYNGSPSEVRALTTYIALSRAATTVITKATEHLRAHNLTPTQFGVLETLYHLGPLMQQEVAHKLLVSTGNLTLVMKNLERDQLITRIRVEDNQRCYSISLTEKGTALVIGLLPAHVAGIVAQMAVLQPEEQEALTRLSRTLGTAR